MKALLLAPMGSVHRRFNTVNIEALQKLGYEVHLAANFEKGEGPEQQNPSFAGKCRKEGIIIHSLPYRRHEIKHNIRLIKPTGDLIRREGFDLVHAHTETGGLILRMVGKIDGRKIYTPHGMSFYKGAPLKAQLLYRPIERWICAGMDCNIAINREEYQTLRNWNPKTARFTHGIGLDTERFRKRYRTREEVRRELGIPDDAIAVLSVGELDDNKNHKVIIDALKDSGAYYVICGVGPNKEKLKLQAWQNGMGDRLILAGYRKDIPDMIGACDLFAFPSYHEGMPVSLLEAMAGGLPAVASHIRGNVDVIRDGVSGRLLPPDQEYMWKEAIESLICDVRMRKTFSAASIKEIGRYSRSSVLEELLSIYRAPGDNHREQNQYRSSGL